MNVSDSLKSIYFNLVSNFYIVLNMFFPYYSEEIVSLQYKTIENINESIIFEGNSRKRRRFNTFIDSLIERNNEFIENIRRQEEEDNNINNYQKIEDEYDNEEYSDNSHSEDKLDEDHDDEDQEDHDDEDQEDHDDEDQEDDDHDEELITSTQTEETIYENDKKNN